MATAITSTRWQKTTPTESRMGAKGREHFTPWIFRKIQDVGSCVSNALAPAEYVTTGTGWGYLIPVSTISDKSKVFGDALDSIVQPLQIISLVVDSVAIILWLQGKNEELEENGLKLKRVFLSIGSGLCHLVNILNQSGLINLATSTLLKANIVSGVASVASALLKLMEVAKGQPSFKNIALAILALVSAGLAVYILFHTNLLINVLYLTLSTVTLFLSGDEDPAHEIRPEVAEIFHAS